MKQKVVIRLVMVFLHPIGVSHHSQAVRIYKTYGEAAIETVRSDSAKTSRGDMVLRHLIG